MDGASVLGTLSRDEIIKALRENKGAETVDRFMNREFLKIQIQMPLEDAWTTMRTKQQSAAPVFSNNELVGMLDTENVAEFLMISEATKKD